ncbi:MAG: STAS domain-containing protein [Bacteroidia bacterium]|nr:STAS domain-containing protein [Bacteroidia bacterium]
MEFEYNITEKDTYALISLKGNLIEKNQASELMDEVNLLSEKDSSNFIINLSDFKYMNSTGLNVLLGILSKARKSGGEAVICAVPEKIKTLLVITKLVNVFSVVDNEELAAKAFHN